MRLNVPPSLEATLQAYAEHHGTTPLEAGKQLMIELAAAISLGVPAFLGPSWQVLRKAETVAQPGKPHEEEPTLTAEQIAPLERSTRLASGFAGVYQQSGGWRATGPDKKWMKTRPTALWAAWDRYQAFKALPQLDPIDETMQWLRGRMPDATDEELRREAESLESLRGGPTPPGM